MSTQTEFSEDLKPEEELYHLQESTNEDGTIDVKIQGWEKDNNDNVKVSIMFPTAETDEMYLKWPKEDSTDYKFVRLVEACGYDIANSRMIKGEKVKFNRDEDSLVVPKNKSLVERSVENIKNSYTKLVSNLDAEAVLVQSFTMLILSSLSFYTAFTAKKELINTIGSGTALFTLVFGIIGIACSVIGLATALSMYNSK